MDGKDSEGRIILGRTNVTRDTVILKSGEDYCPMCKGNARTYGPGTISTCAYCDGLGKVDWLFNLGEKQRRDEEWEGFGVTVGEDRSLLKINKVEKDGETWG